MKLSTYPPELQKKHDYLIKKVIMFTIQFLILVVMIAFNICISYVVRSNFAYYTLNTRPFGLDIPLSLITLILISITIGFYYFRFFEHYTVYTLLIVAGAWSNFIERITFNNVSDYINLIVVIANFADIQIWFGLILLNYAVWFRQKK